MERVAIWHSVGTFLLGDTAGKRLATDWMQDLTVVAYKGPDVDLVKQATVDKTKTDSMRDMHARDAVCVFWPTKPYTKGQLEDICTQFLKPKLFERVVVVSEHSLKTQNKHPAKAQNKHPVKTQSAAIFEYRGIDCTFFSYDDLKFNITKHVLVPRYEVVPHEQLPRLGISLCDVWRLPTLRTTDPVCIFYAWRIGTILKIRSITGKPAPEFRVVRPEHTYVPQPDIDKTPVVNRPGISSPWDEEEKAPHRDGRPSVARSDWHEDGQSVTSAIGFRRPGPATYRQTNIRQFLHGNWIDCV